MTSTMTRMTLVTALLVLVAALGALVNRPDSPLAQDDVEFEVLSGVLVDNGSPGAFRSASSAQVQNRPAQTGGPGGSPSQDPSGQQGLPGGTPGGSPPSTVRPVPPGPPSEPGDPRTFGITGGITGLFPGFGGKLELTLSNPHMFDIVVTDVNVEVADPTGTGDGDPCEVDHLEVDDFVGEVPVARQSTAQVELDIRLLHAATDACQGATWELAYTGTAIRANQQ